MKVRKITFLLFLLVLVFMPFLINASETSEKIAKGTLRCPLNLDLNTSCKEIKNANDDVVQVDLTYTKNEIEIIKTVKKTEILGKYDVSFNVKGDKTIQKKSYGDVYIVIVLDMSKTISDKINEMKTAVESFTQKILEEIPTAKIALVQFATRAAVKRDFKSEKITDICNYNSKCNGVSLKTTSQVGYGLAKANDLLNNTNIPENANKYIVLFGDGRYWYPDDTFWYSSQSGDKDRNKDITYGGNNYVTYQKNIIDTNNINIYGIRYEAYSRGDKFNSRYNKVGGSYSTYGAADDGHMKWIANNNYYAASSADDFLTQFLNVASQIITDPSLNETSISADLLDNIGPAFTIVNSDKKNMRYDVGNLKKEGTSFGPFSIEIEPNVKTGWYETNDDFILTYTDKDGNVQKITCPDNPEVYWIKGDQVIESCSGTVMADEITNSQGTNKYYELICHEGYLQDKFYVHGFQVNATINNLKPETKTFNLKGGLGFPTTISLSTNLYCTYRFKYQKFMNDYNEIQLELRKTNDSKEKAVLNKRLERLEGFLDNYRNVLQEDLDNYITRFTKQETTLRIKYNNKNIPDGVSHFTNVDDPIINKNCNKTNAKIVFGKMVYDQYCTLSMSKNMQLPAVCLNMSDGEQNICNNASMQISGGNKFYTSLSAKSGDITLDIPNAGYSRDLHFKLKDCSYTSTDIKPSYRQIENNDPFLQTYTTPKRKIPKNYSNNSYNFINIIKSDIWENSKFIYRFSLSKLNVYNINQDTNNLGSSKYLGNDCYINNNKKYVCELLHDNSQSGNYFTNIEVNNNKIS